MNVVRPGEDGLVICTSCGSVSCWGEFGVETYRGDGSELAGWGSLTDLRLATRESR